MVRVTIVFMKVLINAHYHHDDNTKKIQFLDQNIQKTLKGLKHLQDVA